MSTTSDFNMLRLEAPRDVLQITDGTAPSGEAVEISNPAVWVRTMVRHQQQAERDLGQLAELCGNTIDRTDRRIQRIEQAYQTLAEGTRYVYDRVHANQEIEEAWVRSELSAAANAYQTFAQNVWQAIIERTQEAQQQQVGQAMQLARIKDALSFLSEADLARSHHLATFQGNVESWAAAHQDKVAALQKELKDARQDIQRLATRIPLPTATPSPAPPSPPPPPLGQRWRSPPRLPSTSAPGPSSPTASEHDQALARDREVLAALRRTTPRPAAAPAPTGPTAYPPLRYPIPLNFPAPTRRIRPPAIPPIPAEHATPPQWAAGGGGFGRPPPRAPSTPPLPPTPQDHQRAPSPPRETETAQLTEDMVRIIAEGVARAQPQREERTERALVSRLKMKSPESFDGKSTTNFNQWWESVTMYLGFYPETVDRQKIAWIGTLLTDTALAWHLHRYRELRDNDTWFNYATAIRAEYHNDREAAEAQAKLGQLRYQGSIRAYLTEFRALNNFARTTGESLREKVDQAVTDNILNMRFNQNPNDPLDDEQFLQATYRAGLQVEKLKALKAAKETAKTVGTTNTRKEEERKKDKKKEEESRPRYKPEEKRGNNRGEYGGNSQWRTEEAAFEGVPISEKREHQGTRGCHRCGRSGHRAAQCYAATTLKGTTLPPAPWKASAVSEGRKRQRSEENEEAPATKQQKVAAVETMEIDASDVPIWAHDSDESDF